jgi:hypothetical protein
MVTRDLKKERGLLGALELEVGFVTEKIGEMIAEIKAGKPPGKFQFEQDCLRKALVEPAWADNDRFLQLTSDLFHSMNREDESPFESASREDQLKELENLNKVASQYHEMINTRIEELDRKIGTKHTNIKDN